MSAPEGVREGFDIFAGTIAEMTWQEVDHAAKDGAVLLWAFGVIEQHGPHLPTGTDVYLPQARLRGVRKVLADRGVRALIVPPYYWGVNQTSGSFPASYHVRPEITKELMSDVFRNFEKDGFRHVFCFSGHGEAAHNRTIHEGVRLGASRTSLQISFVADAALASRVGISLSDPHLALPPDDVAADAPASGVRFFQAGATPASPGAPERAPRYVDVHAGRGESSQMLASCTGLVRDDLRRRLPSTDLGTEELAVWRRGLDDARRTTPLGYLGDPASANADEGRASLERLARRAADAVIARLAAPDVTTESIP
ncbi:creatininase family protein [Hydrogenophaga sp.]|jgi:creatinine amidohydrolase|uniref:creatininase family protein n=1 Tax=Hydrogenophaga sp. TaxID=1904254 RepID=UPI003F72175D